MNVTLTSFADINDLLVFNKKVRNGMSPKKALAYGDNGLGSTGMSTVLGTGAACAMAKPWQSRMVKVAYGDRSVECEVRDTGPKGRCDLNPDACIALGLKPPVKAKGTVTWL